MESFIKKTALYTLVNLVVEKLKVKESYYFLMDLISKESSMKTNSKKDNIHQNKYFIMVRSNKIYFTVKVT